MLLAVDIGNTNIMFGLYAGDRLQTHWRISTERNRTTDEYWVLVNEFIRLNEVTTGTVNDIIISSVVPPLVPVFAELSQRYFEAQPLIVGPGIKTGMPILYKNPAEVGADRIANAVAGYEKFGGPLIVVDFGTATTFDAVSEKGEYLGGAIFPGLKIALEALFRNTARLSAVDLVTPGRVIGKSTVESIQSGTIHGYAGMVETLVGKMIQEIGRPAKVVGTGGLLRAIADQVSAITDVDPFLTLDGLRIIWARNRHSD